MKWKLLIKAAVSALFIAMIARAVSADDLRAKFRELDGLWTVFSVLLSLGMVTVSCLKWSVLLRAQGVREPFPRLMRLYFIGYYFSCLLPSNVGGDLVRSYQTGKRIGSQSKAAVSVFLERMTGYVCLLALTLLTPMAMPSLYRNGILWTISLLAAVLLGGLAALILLPDPGGLARRLAARLLPGRAHAAAEKFIRAAESFRRRLLEALKALRGHRPATAAVIGLTMFFYTLTWLNIWSGFRAFGVSVDPAQVIALTPVCMMISTLPIAPMGSLGLTEGVYFHFFHQVAGISSGAVVAMSLLLRCKVFLLGLIGMVCYLRLPAHERSLPQSKA